MTSLKDLFFFQPDTPAPDASSPSADASAAATTASTSADVAAAAASDAAMVRVGGFVGGDDGDARERSWSAGRGRRPLGVTPKAVMAVPGLGRESSNCTKAC